MDQSPGRPLGPPSQGLAGPRHFPRSHHPLARPQARVGSAFENAPNGMAETEIGAPSRVLRERRRAPGDIEVGILVRVGDPNSCSRPPKMRLVPALHGREWERKTTASREVPAKTSRCGRQPTNSPCRWEWWRVCPTKAAA